MKVICLINMLMTHPSTVPLIPITWPSLCRRMLLSAVSEAALRSSRTNIETSSLSETLKRSLVTLTSSVMGSKTWQKHGKHGSSEPPLQVVKHWILTMIKNVLTADCYHVDGMKFTGLITDQIRDALLKLQGDTVFPVTMTSETSYSMSCPQL